MKSYTKITPEGTKDILFEECKTRRHIESTLSKVFTLRGYNEVLTPGLEYFELFRLPEASIPIDEMFKTTDNNGRLIIFRPDSTLPIARLAATRLKNVEKPLRLFYNQPIYRNTPDLNGRNNEYSQMGIELLGAGGLKSDIEVLVTAIEAISSCTDDFRFEIGHAGFFKELAKLLDLPDEKKDLLKDAIESKNFASIEELLGAHGKSEVGKAIQKLPHLFGDSDILDTAEKYCLTYKMREIIEYMRKLYSLISELDMGDKLLMDLGFVQHNDYYSGIIFSAYSPEFGSPLLNGGRYDNLLSNFDNSMPAVGFSVNTAAITDIMLYNEKLLGTENKPEVIVYCTNGFEIKAMNKVKELTLSGKACEYSVFPTIEETVEYASRMGISKLISISNEIEEITI